MPASDAGAMRLPNNVDEITTDWLSHVLMGSDIGPILSSRILEVMHGTATKIQIALTLAKTGERRTVWLKTGFEAHSHEIGQDTVYAGEAYYYGKLAGRWDTRSPRCHYVKHEPDTGKSVIIMEDILAAEPDFFEPIHPLTAERAGRAVATLARMHASSWMDPLLLSDPWLSTGGAYLHSNVLGWLYSDANWELMSSLPRFRALPPILRNRDLLRDTHARLLGLWREAAKPYCLSHGDAHIGQGYQLPDGRVEFLDWQCVMKNSWANDFSYFLISALSIEDRRECQDDLLAFYLGELKALGATPPDFPLARELYRVYAFHGIGWVCCKPEMQSEENCAAIAERFAAAVLDLDAIEAVQGTPLAYAA